MPDPEKKTKKKKKDRDGKKKRALDASGESQRPEKRSRIDLSHWLADARLAPFEAALRELGAVTVEQVATLTEVYPSTSLSYLLFSRTPLTQTTAGPAGFHRSQPDPKTSPARKVRRARHNYRNRQNRAQQHLSLIHI